MFKEVLTQAHLDKQGFTIHSLRHTFATRCNENGVPPKVLQKWLGHAKADMTMNVYTHCNDDFENSVISSLEKGVKLVPKEK